MNETIEQKAVVEDLVIRQPKAQGNAKEQVLASYLTHELRAPVTAIRLGLEILQEQVNDRLAADERQMLSLAVKNTSRLQGLVNDIMDYTKIVAGKMTVVKAACDSRRLISDAVESLQAWAISKGVKLVKVEGEPLPRVDAEGRRIVQILTNLLSNAIKFTPARGTVTISAKEGQDEHAGALIFSVSDTGCGVPEKDLAKIFDCFNQSVNNGKQGDGTGLGLTLAKSMVDIHGGRIWVSSVRGKGSSFHFSIPIVPEDLSEKVTAYPKPIQYHGLLVDVYRRMNAFIAAFV